MADQESRSLRLLKKNKPETIGMRLRALRKALGYDQRGFGQKVGATQAKISLIEGGRVAAPADLLKRIALLAGKDRTWWKQQAEETTSGTADVDSERALASPEGDVTLGARIKKLRTEFLKMDQRAFAELIGASSSVVSQYETGKINPSPSALIAIAGLAKDQAIFSLIEPNQERADKVERLLDQSRVLAGMKGSAEDDENRLVRVFTSFAGGELRFPPQAASEKLSLPRTWFDEVQRVIGLYIQGEAIPGVIEQGTLALVAIFPRKPKELINKLVAVVGEDSRVSAFFLLREAGDYALVSSPMRTARGSIPLGESQRLAGEIIGWIRLPEKPGTNGAE